MAMKDVELLHQLANEGHSLLVVQIDRRMVTGALKYVLSRNVTIASLAAPEWETVIAKDIVAHTGGAGGDFVVTAFTDGHQVAQWDLKIQLTPDPPAQETA